MSAVELVFWGSLGLAFYACALYPLVVTLVSRMTSGRGPANDVNGERQPSWPSVTLLIVADRDECAIVPRIRNAVALNYPVNRLEILVGCGGQDNLTPLAARSFGDERVQVIEFAGWHSRAAVLNECLQLASGEIVVISDVETMQRPDAIRRLARHFGSPAVGAVCGNLQYAHAASERALGRVFSRFQSAVKRRETMLGAPRELTGGVCAVRKILMPTFPEHASVEDFLIALRVRAAGLTLVHDDSAVAFRHGPPSKSPAKSDASRSHVKSAIGNVKAVLAALPRSPRYTVLTLGFWLHEALRTLVPAFLIAALLCNAWLSAEPFYLHCFLIHELAYLCGLTVLFFLSGKCGRGPRETPAVLAPGQTPEAEQAFALIGQ